jgi:hypothetical protein
VLDHLHVAREAVLEVAHLPDKLLAHLAAAVADWQPQPAPVAVRLPCPERVDVKGGDMIDLLVVTAEAGSWPTHDSPTQPAPAPVAPAVTLPNHTSPRLPVRS